MNLFKNTFLLFASMILYSISGCYSQDAKAFELFEYKYSNCDKTHFIKRYHINDSIFVDSSFVQFHDVLYTNSNTYKAINGKWFYLSEDGEYLPWFSLDKFKRGDTLSFHRVSLSKLPLQMSTLAIPQREEVYNDKMVYVFKIVEPNEILRVKPLEYYFDFDIGLVKIIDSQELKGCREAKLVRMK